ncbi:LacI family DNA-binding transcriptional regulator [Clostridium sp. C2-6-12]|uniref:LacI family DNA-binding transcriptional regulator n=1 Tax=Clostridium sp. C2-6-12 TaxID=2698832 RepID=UPI00136825F1|nr:LacI family DNA-binding transcriptional regulator [Clostridium sp. C2-6-12]
MSKESINIYAIAKEAGVSPATVSRVLTKSARVSKEKRDRVQALIDKYNFKPNILARRLSNTESKTLGILSPDVRNPYFAALFVECEKAANARDYTVLLSNSLGENQLEDAHLEGLFEQRVDAIIQIGGRIDQLNSDKDYVERVNRIANSIPVIIAGKMEGAECYQVRIDHDQSIKILMEYLIELGHREIALVGGTKKARSTYDKQLAFKKSLKEHNIKFKKHWIVEEDNYDIEGGYKCMNHLFDLKKKLPSALIAVNDFMAIGIMNSIREHGLEIPNDISVVSFDNTFVSEIATPKLTTIGYDYTLFGETLIDAAISAIQKKEPPRVQLISSELIIRDSCKNLL